MEDPDWAIIKLSEFIDLTAVRREPNVNSAIGYVTRRPPKDSVAERTYTVTAIVQHVLPDWSERVARVPAPEGWEPLRSAAILARSRIQEEDELRKRLGDSAPQLRADSFHPWAWEGARSMWQSRHYRDAVVAAGRKLNAETQNKLGLRLSETDLFNQAFSPDPPKPDRPRLRIVPDDGSDTYKSLHDGAKALARGFFAGIRNPSAHEDDLPEPSEHEALEQLAIVSVLSRWVDEAVVVKQ